MTCITATPMLMYFEIKVLKYVTLIIETLRLLRNKRQHCYSDFTIINLFKKYLTSLILRTCGFLV